MSKFASTKAEQSEVTAIRGDLGTDGDPAGDSTAFAMI